MVHFQDLGEYITTRAKQTGHSLSSLSETLGFGRSYIHGVVKEQFQPSFDRCWQIAEFFGDSPSIILGLAGYSAQIDQEIDIHTAQLTKVSSQLSHRLKHTLLDYAEFLQHRSAQEHPPGAVCPPPSNVMYVCLPNGDELEIPTGRACDNLSTVEIEHILIACMEAIDLVE